VIIDVGESAAIEEVKRALSRGDANLARAVAMQASERLTNKLRDYGEGPGAQDVRDARHAFDNVAIILNYSYIDTPTALTWEDGHSEYAHIDNPIVRLRFNTRTSTDGTTTLFLEEIQPPQEEMQANMPALFLKNWRELAFKWALQHAAANGYDQVAWTTGDQQVKRYPGVESVVSAIQWREARYIKDGALRHPTVTGTERLTVFLTLADGSGNLAIDVDDAGTVVRVDSPKLEPAKGRALQHVVGAEIAARILGEPAGAITGAELRVGGEGLRRLYDKDFSAVVGRLPIVKRGGSKVEVLRVPFGPPIRMPFPENRVVPIPHDADQATRDRMYAERVEQLKAWDKEHPPIADVREQLGVRITPRMREIALDGQALFQDKPQGDVKGAYNPNTNVLRLVAGKADLSTFLHESGHFFLEVLTDIALKVDPATATPEQQQLLRDLDVVLKLGNYQGTLAEWRQLPIDGRRGVHEAWAESFEQYLFNGKTPNQQLRGLFVQFRDWLYGVYRSAREGDRDQS
jgi:hypothetical protein